MPECKHGNGWGIFFGYYLPALLTGWGLGVLMAVLLGWRP